MSANTITAKSSQAVQSELQAIAEVTDLIVQRRSGMGKLEVARVGKRLQAFLTKNGLSLRDMIDRNMGQAIAGTEEDPTPREGLSSCLRSILDELCSKGVLALAYDRCVFTMADLEPHRNPGGQDGFSEAIQGVYPDWLIPERIRRGIRHNSRVPAAVKSEFAAFAKRLESDGLNERTLWSYWENVRDLALETGVDSITELGGQEGARRLREIFVTRKFHKQTSTVNHWRRVLNEILQSRSPFKVLGADGRPALDIPKKSARPKMAEGKTFHKGGKRHILLNGQIRETRIPFSAIYKIVHFESTALSTWRSAPPERLPALFAEAQEDVLAKFWGIIKHRPAELWSQNVGDWKMYPAQAHNPDSERFDGDGEILNNFREGRRKPRASKPFPKWLARLLERLLKLRRAAFAGRGDCDQRQEKATGIIRIGVPLWVDRTGARASDGTILAMLRRALLRAGMPAEEVKAFTGYWMRKSVINIELDQAKLFIAKSSSHSVKTADTTYFGVSEMAMQVAAERESFWKALGIVELKADPLGNAGPAAESPESVKKMLSAALAKLGEKIPEIAHMGEAEVQKLADSLALDSKARVSEREAAKFLGVSLSTVRRYAGLCLVRKFLDKGRVFYLRSELDAFRNTYAKVCDAAKYHRTSTSYIRRLCRKGVFKEAKRIGKKAFLIPWAECRAFKTAAADRGGKEVLK